MGDEDQAFPVDPEAGLPMDLPAPVAGRRVATRDDLMKKTRRADTVVITLTGDDGEETQLELHYVALSSREWDRLTAAHEPTSKQRAAGTIWNIDTLGPAVLSRVCVDPALTAEEWKAISESDEWSGGEYGYIVNRAIRICQAGFDIPFIGLG